MLTNSNSNFQIDPDTEGPRAEALIRKNLTINIQNIPVVVTDVPSIESPGNFEDLLHDPNIVFKGQSGLEKSVNVKTIKKLANGPTAMDRAR